jgi:hypothetical protein
MEGLSGFVSTGYIIRYTHQKVQVIVTDVMVVVDKLKGVIEMVKKQEIKKSNEASSLGIAGFVVSIIAFLSIMAPFVGLVLGVVGLILNHYQTKIKETKLVVAGNIISIIAIVINILLTIGALLSATI